MKLTIGDIMVIVDTLLQARFFVGQSGFKFSPERMKAVADKIINDENLAIEVKVIKDT